MRTRIVLIAGVIIALIGGAYAWKEYNRTAKDAGAMQEVLTVSAHELQREFRANEQAANAKYVGTTDQAIKVKGMIRAIEPAEEGRTNVLLDSGEENSAVVCEFSADALPKSWAAGQNVFLKGICTGVNDLIPDVILVRCSAVE
ncbi:MAG: hypothetical protein IPP83_05555 [Flavobacteriales bacterium]|nr:hypothetical protein [Flavobacteriales bacterium]